MRAVLLIVTATLVAAGCGQRGPLYLRDKPPASVRPVQEEPYRPVPYPGDVIPQAPAERKKDPSTDNK